MSGPETRLRQVILLEVFKNIAESILISLDERYTDLQDLQ